MVLVELGSPWLFYYLTWINIDHILVMAVPIYSKMENPQFIKRMQSG